MQIIERHDSRMIISACVPVVPVELIKERLRATMMWESREHQRLSVNNNNAHSTTRPNYYGVTD